VDANASRALAGWLLGLGHDAVCVVNVDPRMPDEEVLDWAVRERRVLVTTDHDFEELIWRRGRSHCGVLRLENLPREQRRRLLQSVLQQYSDELAGGAIVIATRTKTRIRHRS